MAGLLLALARAFAEGIPDAEADVMVAGVVEVGDSKLGRYMLMSIAEQLSLSPERPAVALGRVRHDTEAMEALMGTAAQAWFEEGEARGMSETLVRQLKRRFGPCLKDYCGKKSHSLPTAPSRPPLQPYCPSTPPYGFHTMTDPHALCRQCNLGAPLTSRSNNVTFNTMRMY